MVSLSTLVTSRGLTTVNYFTINEYNMLMQKKKGSKALG